MSEQIKIAFSGLMRSGKDASGEYLAKTYGCRVMKFATPLYDIMHYAQKRARKPQEKWRKFLQIVGTELFRVEDPDVWVNLLIAEVKDLGPSANVVVTDARFNNEFRALKQNGFVLVKLERPDTERDTAEAGGIKEDEATHASEMDVLAYTGFDHVLINDGALEDLYQKLDDVILQHYPMAGSVHQMVPALMEQFKKDCENMRNHWVAELKAVDKVLDSVSPRSVIEIQSLEDRRKRIIEELRLLS